MPTKPATHLDEFDYDVAMLGEPLADDALDALSSVIDARDALTEMQAHINHMQAMLEAGAPAYRTREQFAVDLEQLSERIQIAISGVLG